MYASQNTGPVEHDKVWEQILIKMCAYCLGLLSQNIFANTWLYIQNTIRKCC